MTLAELSIKRPVFAWMLMASLIIFGALSFRTLGISQLPAVDFPVVNVRVSLEGASPEVMESDVVDVIESAVVGIQGLKNLTSSARYGSASITLEFELDQNIDVALQEVQAKVSQAQRQLPNNIDPPVISKSNPEDQPILWLGISGDMKPNELMKFVKNNILPQFQIVQGVGEVTLGGYLEPNIRIWLDLKKMAAYELTVDDVIGALDTEHIEYPAGTLQEGEKEFSIRLLGEAATVEEVEKIAISRRGGSVNYVPVKLKDIARIESGTEDVRRLSRAMGKAAVGLGIRKQWGTNAVEVAQTVKAKMAEVAKSLPPELNINVNFDGTKFIEETVKELEFELVLSALLTGLVCWLFFGSLSSTFNILLAIPTSLIGTFMAIKFFGFTLNTFTFLALILSVGIVVDDAIMVLENIVRHRELGLSKVEAARKGANQITFAAMATTIAIVAIFLPVAFMKGLIGKYFFEFGVTLSFAVLLSLLEALTLTPMRSAQFLSVSSDKKPLFERGMHSLSRYYARSLQFALNHRWIVIGISAILFSGSLLLLKGLKKEFSPAQDQGRFIIRIQAPIGSSFTYTDQMMKQVESELTATPEVLRYFGAVGGFGGGTVNTGMLFVTLKEDKNRRSQLEVMNEVRTKLKKLKGLRVVLQDLSTQGIAGQRGFPIEFSLRGPDWDTLVAESKRIQDVLEKDGRFLDVDSNYDEGMPEVKIVPDRQKAQALGVSVDSIGKTISSLVGGSRIGRFTDSGRRIDVRIKLEDEFRSRPQDILNLFIRNNRGELIRLSDVARIETQKSLVSISRIQRERAINVYSNITQNASQAELIKKVEGLQSTLPSGYRVVTEGTSKTFQETFDSLIFALVLGVIVAYMILASQFNSYIHPVTVLLALPFSLTGAWLALSLSGQSLNIYSMIGLVLLMGIVKKNSIMLVDFTNQVRANDGLAVREALEKACPIRLRPILMTSLSVIAAALPSVAGFGPGSETRVPMSLSVIGGVLLSTLFTLYVVPCAYSLFSRLERKAHSDSTQISH